MSKKPDFMDEIITGKGMSRRDALKVMGISPIAAAAIATTSTGSITKAEAADVKGKIVVVGAGSGGIMAAVRLSRAISNPDITIIAPNEKHIYQPAQVFVAAGETTTESIIKDNKDFIPSDVKWIKDEVKTFDPDNNKVITRKGEEVSYDYLVVATGLQYHYEMIKGLTIDDIGKNGISSVYLNNPEEGTAKGGDITHAWFKELHKAAKEGKKSKVLCTQPGTPIKCGGAPQKILYLSDDYLKRDGLTADFTFATSGSSLFGLPSVRETLEKVVQPYYGNITNKFGHELVAIDPQKKVATFEHKYEIKGAYDEDIEEYAVIKKSELIDLEYDFIHVVPPMSAPDAVVNSPLGWQKGSAQGWLEVDKETLQHRRYKNVFGIGDVCGIPKGKTGGSARHHGPIVVANLLAEMQKKELKEKFDGYTVCPLKTRYGRIIMAEFNYKGEAPSFPLAVNKERWMWWAFDLYALEPMYWNLMLRGLM